MAIVIYTYSNPYRLHKEPYWGFIKNGFHLCASQTLANGLCDQYKNDFFIGKLTTITRFINTLYDEWESSATEINQRAAVDNLIGCMPFDELITEDVTIEDIRMSLRRNRMYVVKSIRIMFELGMNPEHIQDAALTYEQKCVVEIYRELRKTKNKFFMLKDVFSAAEMDSSIKKTMEEALHDSSNKEKIRSYFRGKNRHDYHTWNPPIFSYHVKDH